MVDKMLGHNHGFDTQAVLVCQKLSNIMEQKAVHCLSNKPSKIIRWALTEDGTRDVLESDLEQFCKNMYEL